MNNLKQNTKSNILIQNNESEYNEIENNENNNNNNINTHVKDLKDVFEHITNLKKEIDLKIRAKCYIESILLINNCLNLSKKFYSEDHIFTLDLILSLSECYINIGNLEEGIYNLENLLEITSNLKNKISSTSDYRFKALMLVGSISLNIGDYTKALKVFEIAEKEVELVYSEPEVNIKSSAINLNIGITYIHLNNYVISEKYLKKALKRIDGILGSDLIHKLTADINENLGLIYDNISGRSKELAISYFKKSLKYKYSLLGDKHDDVLDIQYKITSCYVSLKQYKEAEEIISSVTKVIIDNKLKLNDLESDNELLLNNNSNIENNEDNNSKYNNEINSFMENNANNSFYRYGVYFYTQGFICLKLQKKNKAKNCLKRAEILWKNILNKNDQAIVSLNNMLKIC